MSLSVFLTVFGLIFIAEMGDKTQIVAMLLATRFDWKRAFAGIALAFALINLLAVLVGQLLFTWIDLSWVRLGAGVLFVFFGITALRGRNGDEGPVASAEMTSSRGPFFTSFLIIFLAEMGDKTQLMTATLAAQHAEYAAVFAGSTLALWLVSTLGMAIGVLVVKRVPLRLVRGLAGLIFIAFGIIALAQGATLRGWLPCIERLRALLC